MPPRVMPSQVGEGAMRNAFVRLAGFFDDPAAGVRVSVGPGAGTRPVTLQVIDRLGEPWSPDSYNLRPRVASTGRWWVWAYFSGSEFGAPLDVGLSVVAGTLIDTWTGPYYLLQTDASGKVVADATKVAGELWVHAAVPALLRSSGFDWSTGGKVPGGGEFEQ